MRGFALLLVGCSGAAVYAPDGAADLDSAQDMARVGVPEPDFATLADLALPPADLTTPPDLTACGHHGEPCCAGSVCSESQTTCTPDNICRVCGTLGTYCCSDGVCTGSWCRFACLTGSCQPRTGDYNTCQ